MFANKVDETLVIVRYSIDDNMLYHLATVQKACVLARAPRLPF